MPDERTDTVLFSTPPTPNGGLHLGHISGPYLAGDILRRRMTTQDHAVAHIGSFDDHTSYVVTKSRQLGELPEAVARRYAASIRHSWAAMGIEIDVADNPIDDPDYVAFCAAATRALLRTGNVVVRTADALYEKDTGAYLHEALVFGQCPVCKQPADGDACEFCGHPHETVDLINPVSTLNPDSELEIHAKPFLYFPLEHHRDFLVHYAGSTEMSERLLALTLGMLAEPLPDIRISHEVPWGIPLDLDVVQGHRLYPWFEMGLLYLWLLRQHFGPDSLTIRDDVLTVSDRLRRARIVNCYGFDNAYFHTLLFPALFHALGDELPVTAHHISNELLHLDGEKFSTSRNHVISVETALAHADPDLVRLYLCAIRPEHESTNFTVADFETTVNTRVIEPLNAMMERFADLCASGFDGTVPEPGSWHGTAWAYQRGVARRVALVEDNLGLHGFSPQRATRELLTLLGDTRVLLDAAQPLVDVPDAKAYVRTAVALAAVGIDTLRRELAPIAPSISAALAAVLPSSGAGSAVRTDAWQPWQPLNLDGMRPCAS